MIAAILSIGDELVFGDTVDTNSAWLADRLRTLGIETSSKVWSGIPATARGRAAG